MVKVKLITHTDLDGVGCEIVGRLAFYDIDVTHADYWNVNDIVKEFITSGEYLEYDRVFITDISVNEEVEELINTHLDLANKLALIDHHQTAEWLRTNPWAFVEVAGKNGKNSGTNLFFEFLNDMGMFRGMRGYMALMIFVEKVRRYDTWEWKEIYDDIEAGELNQLLYLIGRKKFADQYVNRLNTSPMFSHFGVRWREMFSETDKVIIAMDNDNKDSYIIRKQKQMKVVNFLGNRVGVVFAEQYISELGNRLSEMNQDLKYIAIVDMGSKKVSLRTIHETINLGKDVAKLFGGGGHPKASGFNFDAKIVDHAINFIFGIGFLSKLRKCIDKFTKK